MRVPLNVIKFKSICWRVFVTSKKTKYNIESLEVKIIAEIGTRLKTFRKKNFSKIL